MTFLNSGTGACLNCAQALVYAAYANQIGYAWFALWELRLRQAIELAAIELEIPE